ncbi:MAG: type II toxin-antitoxin system VapC family toxin [Pseudonocardiaceae bacterium]
MAIVILLGASVLIAYLDSEDGHRAAADRLLAVSIEDEFAVNTLTLAEVLVVPVRDNRLDAVLAVLRDLAVAELPLPPDSAVRLAQLRADTALKMPDCCVAHGGRCRRARVRPIWLP